MRGVYPRVCGGSHGQTTRCTRTPGSIPACAGGAFEANQLTTETPGLSARGGTPRCTESGEAPA